MRIPPENLWKIPNTSDKFGSLQFVENMNFDELGYMKLSQRMMLFHDSDDNNDFGIPLAFIRISFGSYIVPTSSNAVFNVAVDNSTQDFLENSGTNEPTCTSDSHGEYFNDLLLVSTATSVFSRALSGSQSAAWTSRITELTSGKRHFLRVFKNRNTICVTNGNVVKQYTTAYAASVDLTIPSDYEAIGLAYNADTMAVVTRPASVTANGNAYFFVWDGATTSAGAGYDTGSDVVIAVAPYLSSFALITRAGELLYFNGGGFTKLAQFPFYFSDFYHSSSLNDLGYGDIMTVGGDKIYINTLFDFSENGRKRERYLYTNPSGIWCFDPKVGLYHRSSLSISPATLFICSNASTNVTTDILTVLSGTVPATGTRIRYTTSGSDVLGGLTIGTDYFVINVSSSTFKLATTHENALTGVAVDITSKGTGSSDYFFAYEVKDFGTSYVSEAGAVNPVSDTTQVYGRFIAGGDLYDTDLTNKQVCCLSVPFLENRGCAVLPKIFSQGKTDKAGKLSIRFRPLTTGDSIHVYVRSEDVYGLPVSNTGTAISTWTGTNELYTTFDLSEAKTYLDAGGSLLMKVTAGSGGGAYVPVSQINTDDDLTYSLVLEEEVNGVTAGDKCYFLLMNYRKVDYIDSTSEEAGLGYAEFNPEAEGKFIQYLIELRGNGVTIEDIDYPNKVASTV